MSAHHGIFRLTYVSRNKLPSQDLAQEEAIERILASSQRNNALLDISGALLFSTDCFAQTLEGPMAAVEALFERIQLDDRHSDTTILQVGPVADRGFGAWSMAYAGRHPVDRLRFDALTGESGVSGQGELLGLLHGVVLRAAPALVTAV